MPKIRYQPLKRFHDSSRLIIDRANTIITNLQAQGHSVTLRQLYYQFVARDWLPNTKQNYKRLTSIISDARRAGLIDWLSIVDRTRYLREIETYSSPEEAITRLSQTYAIDFWASQKYRPEVWIEKDALLGVLAVACDPWRAPYSSCRGFTSDSELWGAGRRMRGHLDNGQEPIVFYLGDHDPSGVDMTRDIFERVCMFAEYRVTVKRIALNTDQIEQYNPPPAPAKTTDSRYEGYAQIHGDEAWELDALEPTVITQLIASEMQRIIDKKAWEASKSREAREERQLAKVAENWTTILRRL